MISSGSLSAAWLIVAGADGAFRSRDGYVARRLNVGEVDREQPMTVSGRQTLGSGNNNDCRSKPAYK